MTTIELLAQYNSLASRPIKAWKGSKTELAKRIKALNGSKTMKVAKTSNGKVITVATLARETGQNPKIVRARFRRLYANGGKNLPKPVKDEGWTFSIKDRAKLLTIVKVA